MITSDQILMHLIGDYVTQSDWMANEKTKRFAPAAIHAVVYSLGFLLFRPSIAAWLVIWISHFFIDRYRLARYVVWAKNAISPWTAHIYGEPPGPGERRAWSECTTTGYPPERPIWLSVWLLIIADNVIHLSINGLALRFL